MASKAWTSFWQTVARFETSKLNPWLALRNTLGVALPLAAGSVFGAVSGGLAAATGALNVSFSDGQEPYRERARRMLAASVLVGVAVYAGALCGNNNSIAVVVVTAWAFAAGMLVALSTRAADLGAISLVTLIVFMAVPQPLDRAVVAGLLAFSGGLLQTLLAIAFWPLLRHAAERHALGDLYTELARIAAEPVQAREAPPASASITAAQTALGPLARDRSVAAERYRLLLSQAERLRLGLMLLGRLRIRIEREDADNAGIGAIDRFFETCSRILHAVGNALRTGQPAAVDIDTWQELALPAAKLREPDPARQPIRPMVLDARFQMDAISGQLRSAVELSRSTTPAGLAAFDRHKAPQPWLLRVAVNAATFRAKLSPHTAALPLAPPSPSCTRPPRA